MDLFNGKIGVKYNLININELKAMEFFKEADVLGNEDARHNLKKIL